MHACTRPSPQLRTQVRDALLRSLHHSSFYRRLIVTSKEKGACTKTTGHALHKKVTHSPREGISLLNFLHGHIYNDKLAMRYGHAPTDACPLCHMPDFCTHIAWECPGHEALRISRHNAACQLVHAAIRKTAKGGGTLYSAPDLILVMADTCVQPMTQGDSIESLSPTLEDTNPSQTTGTIHQDGFVPFPTTDETRRRRHIDASIDPRYNHSGFSPPLKTKNAPQRQAASRIGFSHMERPS